MLVFLLWVLVVFQMLGALATILMVGKKREPTTGGMAVFVVMFNIATSLVLVWAIAELT